MAVGDMTTTIVGNVGGDPELRFTPTGAAVCNASVAVTPRTFNRLTQAWEDGETTWVRLNIWRELAEHVAESIEKGMRVIVTGRISNRRWENNEGETRYSLEMNVDAIGPDLRYATAKVTKAQRRDQPPPPADPWTPQSAAGRGADPWSPPAGQPDEPPY
ncbi:single-stranded DNA-binding protein [Phytoactinopolyspora limicola]|uniref:single-stranded DNA-binding protein n=1 Tax=Phytoactinopolyspora limicola TaxID=2715536 RepID=UPI00140D401F|nr:single-stranded DNA-binding protein [Phytoactinopolyspora limicola]